MRLEPAHRVSLSEVILERLLERMRQGELKPGDRLPSELQLSEMFRVGRSSVREAVRALSFMGVIESKPGRGAVVVMRIDNPVPPKGAAFALQSSAMRDLYETRQFLEGGAAALAAERATPEDLIAIEQAAKSVEARFAQGESAFRQNVEFHLTVGRASHNNVLVESLRRLLGQIQDFRKQVTDPIPDLPRRDVTEHRAILDAIRAGKGSQAQALMAEHIAGAARAVGLGSKPAGRATAPQGGRRLTGSASPQEPTTADRRRRRGRGTGKTQ